MKFDVKKPGLYSDIIDVGHFFHDINFKLSYFVFPAVLALLAAVLEGASVGLLIPTLKGILASDFSFVKETPILKDVIQFLPEAIEKKNEDLFLLLIALVFSAALLKNILQYASSLSVAFQIRRLANVLRQRIYERYLSFGKFFFDQNNSGNLHQILVGYTEQIAAKLYELHSALYCAFTIIVYFFVLCIISWQLSILVLVTSPILVYTLKWLVHKIKMSSESYVKAYSALGKEISNALSCMPLVKAYTYENKEKERFAGVSEQVERFQFSIDKKQLLIYPMQEILTLLMIMLFVAVTTFLLFEEKTGEVASFMVFFFILKRTMSTLTGLNNLQGALAGIRGPIIEVSRIFNDKDKYYVTDGDKEFTGLKSSIEFNDLNYSYLYGVNVLKGITFSIEKGKLTAIVGSSGSGKTTLMNLIFRFYDSPPGAIVIDGSDIREFTLTSLRSRMALVSQETFLFNSTLRANLIYGNDSRISDQELNAAVKKARLEEFVSKLPEGFETEVGDRGVKLSGGEKQRVSIARAILKKAEILILDEATSALDSQTERLIQAALDELIQGKTTIVIAHRLSTIKHADKIVVVEDGQVVEEGTLNELLQKKGKFYQYWDAQKFY